MIKKFLLIFFFLLTFCFSFAQSSEEQIIRNSLETQRLAWNEGDINKFMRIYWQSDSLMFVGKTGVTFGWQQTKENYEKSYPDKEAMGKLDFSIIQVKRLSVMYFHVTGKWNLKSSLGDLSGHFTLLFKKINNKWVIISDHSS